MRWFKMPRLLICYVVGNLRKQVLKLMLEPGFYSVHHGYGNGYTWFFFKKSIPVH